MTASDHAQQRSQRFPLPRGGRPQMESAHLPSPPASPSLALAVGRVPGARPTLPPRRATAALDPFRTSGISPVGPGKPSQISRVRARLAPSSVIRTLVRQDPSPLAVSLIGSARASRPARSRPAENRNLSRCQFRRLTFPRHRSNWRSLGANQPEPIVCVRSWNISAFT